jgi:HEXXH motif-containing protein
MRYKAQAEVRMQPSRPESPSTPFDLPDLTLPRTDTRTTRRILTLYRQRTLQEFLRLPTSLVPGADRALWQEVARLAAGHVDQEPRKALHIAGQPTISVLIQTLATSGPALHRRLRECCALVLLELACLRELPEPGVTVGRDAQGWLPVLRSPTARMQLEPGADVQGLHFANSHLGLRTHAAVVTVPLQDLTFVLPEGTPATLTRPYHPIAAGLLLATVDNNPLSEFEAHPDKHGNHLDLGGHPPAEWVQVLQQALALVDTYLPLLGEELRLVMKLIVPVGWDPEKHLSASYQEAIGQLYMTLHPNLMTMTEALIHEFQHNKVNAAFRMDPLLHNAWSPLFASPVRPDPRPLHGVVLAVHAFQPVAALYEAMLAAGDPLASHPHFVKRYGQIVKLNHEGATTVLDHAQPTEAGAGLFAEMRAWDEHFATVKIAAGPDGSFDRAPTDG